MSVSSYYNPSVSQSSEITRKSFIRKTYIHLSVAILAFSAISWFFIVSEISSAIAKLVTSTSYTWLILIGAFMLVSYIANLWANSDTSKTMQYFGLGLYVLAESIIFAPLLLIAASLIGVELIFLAGALTLFLTGALTFFTFLNRIDFSFLSGFLFVGGFVALGIVLLGMLLGFSLGLWFSGAMILFAAGAILYDTSNIMLRYREDQYVAASLALFASIALLFYYILTFLLRFTNRN